MNTSVVTLSIACPAYNEAAGLADVVRRWVEYLHRWRPLDDFEIVVCNDGSRDGTGQVLDCLQQQFSVVKAVHHAVNQGAAAALTTAIAHSTGEWVLLLDADDQFPIENLPRLWAALTDTGADAAIGYRPKKEDTLFARFGSWASGQVCGCIYGRRLKDFNSALKLVRGPLLRGFTMEAKGLNYSTEISGRLLELASSIRVVEIEAVHVPRRTGRSSRAVVRGAWHRFLFVSYLAFRRFLQSQHVLQEPQGSFTHRKTPV